MRSCFREVPQADRCEVAKLALEWGYPREIHEFELQDGAWVKYGEKVLIWFTPGPEEDTVCLHVIGDPVHSKGLGSARNLMALETIAELLGANRLYALLSVEHTAQGVPVAAMRRYLRMRGWAENQWGAYRDLGEE